MKRGFRALLVAAAALSFPSILTGAGITGGEESTEQDHFQVAWVYGFGTPVEFTVRASRGKVSMAGSVRFILEASYPVGWRITFPAVGETMGGLLVRERIEGTPALDRWGNMVSSREYVLEPLSPGLFIIPPVEILVSEDRGEYAYGIESDVVPIVVTSLIQEGSSEPPLLDMTIIADPDPAPVHRWILISGMTATLIAATVGFFLLRRKSSSGKTEQAVTNLQIARKELDSLLLEGLVERGEYRAFYIRLCSFLRKYIGTQFGIPTFEKTTEELLLTIDGERSLWRYRNLLSEILLQCDLVKYSRYEPASQILQKRMDRIRDFVEATASIRRE
jgi:hypothetical protein